MNQWSYVGETSGRYRIMNKKISESHLVSCRGHIDPISGNVILDSYRPHIEMRSISESHRPDIGVGGIPDGTRTRSRTPGPPASRSGTKLHSGCGKLTRKQTDTSHARGGGFWRPRAGPGRLDARSGHAVVGLEPTEVLSLDWNRPS